MPNRTESDYVKAARILLIDISKRKGYHEDSYTNFVVTPEEIAPYLRKISHVRVLEELESLRRKVEFIHADTVTDRIHQIKKESN